MNEVMMCIKEGPWKKMNPFTETSDLSGPKYGDEVTVVASHRMLDGMEYYMLKEWDPDTHGVYNSKYFVPVQRIEEIMEELESCEV